MDWLETPNDDFGGFPVCPFLAPERKTNKLLIEFYNPEEGSIFESIKKFEKEMEAAGLTTEDISRLKNLSPEDLLLIEYGTAKGKENLKLSKPAIEFLNNYYDKQQK